MARRQEKSRNRKNGSGIELAGCPDKTPVERAAGLRPARTAEGGCPHMNSLAYAVLRGRTVKSRNWVRTLDICIPFS